MNKIKDWRKSTSDRVDIVPLQNFHADLSIQYCREVDVQGQRRLNINVPFFTSINKISCSPVQFVKKWKKNLIEHIKTITHFEYKRDMHGNHYFVWKLLYTATFCGQQVEDRQLQHRQLHWAPQLSGWVYEVPPRSWKWCVRVVGNKSMVWCFFLP